MSILQQVLSKPKPRGLRVLIYADNKVGKSYFGAQIPNHLFLNIENGLDHLPNAVRTPHLTDFAKVNEVLTELATTEHPYKTLVIDSADALEALLKKHIVKCQNNPKLQDIADIPYGRGYPILLAETRAMIDKFEYLSRDKGINLVFLAHHEIKKIQPPIGAEYTYISPSLYAKTTHGDSTLQVYCDYVDVLGFAEFKSIVTQTSTGFGSRGQAIGTGERILHLDAGNPAYKAGSRYPMPKQIEFSWPAFINALMEGSNAQQPETPTAAEPQATENNASAAN